MTDDDRAAPVFHRTVHVGSDRVGVFVTPAAAEAVARGGVADLGSLLRHHAQGQPGWLHPDDLDANAYAYAHGGWYMSVWRTGDPDDPEVWVITEEGHETTTVVLPHER